MDAIQVEGLDSAPLYGEDKAKIIYDRRVASGLYELDTDFPDDPEEHWVWHKVGAKVELSSITSESMEAVGERELNHNEATELLSEGGALQSGLMISMPGATDAGQASFESMLAKVDVSMTKPKKKAPSKDDDDLDDSAISLSPLGLSKVL